MNRNQATQLDTLFDALASAKRRGILLALAHRPATISQLADEFELSLPAIHKHIRRLESAGLIQRRKVGRTNFVALRREGLRLVQAWVGQFRADWGNDQASLENFIKRLGET